MTIGAWIVYGFIVLAIAMAVVRISIDCSALARAICIAIGAVVAVGFLVGMLAIFAHTESGKRALIDERSELNGGIERTINVYTANGDILASYTGKIDIADADGGYVKFDYNGKRYIYYNCFVETIAELEEK